MPTSHASHRLLGIVNLISNVIVVFEFDHGMSHVGTRLKMLRSALYVVDEARRLWEESLFASLSIIRVTN